MPYEAADTNLRVKCVAIKKCIMQIINFYFVSKMWPGDVSLAFTLNFFKTFFLIIMTKYMFVEQPLEGDIELEIGCRKAGVATSIEIKWQSEQMFALICWSSVPLSFNQIRLQTVC